MENHSGYQRQLILARMTRVNEGMDQDTSCVGEEMPEEISRLVIEYERLITVALGRGFSLDDFVELHWLKDDEVLRNDILRDRCAEPLVEAAIQAREDSLFDALVALVPETLPIGQGQ